MRALSPTVEESAKGSDFSVICDGVAKPQAEIEACLLTGGGELHYILCLADALVSRGVCLDVIGGDAGERSRMRALPNLSYLNLRGNQSPDVSFLRKVSRVLAYYGRLVGYARTSRPKIFHILWNNKFQVFDRTLLMLFYKIQGKRVVLTAHNINAGRRDSTDSLLNRLSLRFQYQLADHIFVHTEKMKTELVRSFGVRDQAVTVIPHGINHAVPRTRLTRAEARSRLGLQDGEKVLLSFGLIRPYKGLEFLVDAFRQIASSHGNYRLIVAGQVMKGHEKYWEDIQSAIQHLPTPGRVILKCEYIPDDQMEVYFKAADALVLSYTEIFQSGVLLLAYSFGLPVIATEVGSFREDVIEGKTGFLCRPRDPMDLASAIERYFHSHLFKDLNNRRQEIRSYAEVRYSWDAVAAKTLNVYTELSGKN